MASAKRRARREAGEAESSEQDAGGKVVSTFLHPALAGAGRGEGRNLRGESLEPVGEPRKALAPGALES